MDYATIQRIPIELLVEHPENSNFMKAEMAQKLRRHIEQTGRYEPLTVRRHPSEDEKFQVVNGHNRLRVLRALEFQTVNCVVWNLDDRQTRLYLATLNRLSGQDIPERRAVLLDNLLRSFNKNELSALLPDGDKQLEHLERLAHLDIPEYSREDSGRNDFDLPVMLTFTMNAAGAQELNLAIDLVLNRGNRDMSRGEALAYLARNYLLFEPRKPDD